MYYWQRFNILSSDKFIFRLSWPTMKIRLGGYISAFVFVLIFIACHEEKGQTGKFDLKRLEGNWLFRHESTLEMAQWKVEGDGNLTGTGFVLDGEDTTFIEFLQIQETANGLVYYASTGRSDTLHRVPYSLATQTVEKMEFVNPKYGFPQKVVFDLPNDSTLYFYIEGMQEQKPVRINFIYQRQ